MVGGSRIRQIGWALVLAICFALLLALTFKVNAVKSDVRLAERRIIAAQQAKLMLETEFETRASQQHRPTGTRSSSAIPRRAPTSISRANGSLPRSAPRAASMPRRPCVSRSTGPRAKAKACSPNGSRAMRITQRLSTAAMS